MSNVKISQLPDLPEVTTGVELVPIVQEGVTYHANLSQLAAGIAFVNIKAFGAVDGADATTAIRNAIAAVSAAGGGVVYIPNGTYTVSGTIEITSPKTTIRGQSKGGTIITRSGDFGSTFSFSGDSGTGTLLGDCGIESLTIKSTGLTTNGAHVDFVGVTRSYVKDIYFLQGFIGMRFNASTACTVSDIYLVFTSLFGGTASGRRYMDFGNGGGAYSHQSSGDIFVSNFNIRGNATYQVTEYGIRIASADGIWFSNGHVGNSSTANILITGNTAEPTNLVYFSNVMSDEGTTYSLLLDGNVSANYRDIKFVNCNFKSGGSPVAYCSYGIVVATGCIVQHALFDNCTVSEFGLDGVILQSTASRMIKFSGCHVFGNSRNASGTLPGYNLYVGIQDVEISGGLSGRLYDGSGTGTQSYGVLCGGSHSNVRLVGINLTGNAVASTSGTASVYMADCITQNSLIVASASTLILPDYGEQFHVSGTTTVDNIRVTQTGRTVVLIFDDVLTVTDTGNKTLAGAFTSVAGDTLTLSYDGTNWVEVSRSYIAGSGPGSFTTLSASSTVSGAGFTTYLASPPAIGLTAPAEGKFTTLTTTGNATIGDAATDTLTVQAGTALLPSITPSGDQNTGLYFPATDVVGLATGGTLRFYADASGNIGFGGAPAATTGLYAIKSITGGAVAYGMYLGGQVASGTVTDASYYKTAASSSAGAGTTHLYHYSTAQGTYTGAVTNQYGFEANASMIGAANNYGFYGAIPVGAGRWNFYAVGTAANWFGGVTYQNANYVMPKTSGVGIQVDTTTPTFGWRDITSSVDVRGTGANDPTFATYTGTTLRQYQFSATVMNEVFIVFHVPHDYVPGTSIYLHTHWSNAAAAPNTGNVIWGFDYSFAKGFNQAAFPATTNITVTQACPATRYQHNIAETAAINIAAMEVDGLLMVRCYRDAAAGGDTCTDAVFLHSIDVHYQSTNLATKQKAPNFYA